MLAGPEQRRAVLRHERADREPAAQRLRHGDGVRLDAVVLEREELASAPDARLHLVQQQQDAGLVAPWRKLRQVVVVRDVDAAFALDRLHQHAPSFAVRRRLDRLDVVERHAQEALQQRREGRAVRSLADAVTVAIVRPWNAPSMTMIS